MFLKRMFFNYQSVVVLSSIGIHIPTNLMQPAQLENHVFLSRTSACQPEYFLLLRLRKTGYCFLQGQHHHLRHGLKMRAEYHL